MDARQKTLNLLARFKCEKLRSNRHSIYRLPSGEHYTTPQTASDHRAWDNCLAQLKVHLGISRQNKKARVGTRTVKRKKITPPSTPSRYASIPAAPVGFGFGEKIRAAIRGEKPSHPEPISHAHQKSIPSLPAKPRFRTIHEREPHGAVRVWSKADIDAANIAMRAGKLTQFLNLHHQASQPATQPEENTTMLGVDQIDATIAELTVGMATAAAEQKRETNEIHRLESEIAEAKRRLDAASDKHNSLNDVKTSLSVLREDIEKVRPMLGLLANKPGDIVVRKRTTSKVKVADAVREVLDRASRPMRVAEMWKEVIRIPGAEQIARTSLYTFLSVDLKKNGSAIAHRVADNQYVRASHHAGAA